MRDEATELAAALGEAQNAQIEAESKVVSLQQRNDELKRRNQFLEERVLQLESANVTMDSQLQEYRTEYRTELKPNPRAVDTSRNI